MARKMNVAMARMAMKMGGAGYQRLPEKIARKILDALPDIKPREGMRIYVHKDGGPELFILSPQSTDTVRAYYWSGESGLMVSGSLGDERPSYGAMFIGKKLFGK